MPTTAYSENALLDRALSGDEDAFVELVDLYHAPLLRFARTFVRQPSQAEDVVQDAWVGVLRGLERFERRSSFKTWLFSIVANRAKTRAVREQRYVQFDVREDGSDAAENFTEDGRRKALPREWKMTPERLVLSVEMRALVEAALEQLPDNQRVVVTLRDIEQLDASDVCDVLGVSEANQRVLLHRGRTKVRSALAAALG